MWDARCRIILPQAHSISSSEVENKYVYHAASPFCIKKYKKTANIVNFNILSIKCILLYTLHICRFKTKTPHTCENSRNVLLKKSGFVKDLDLNLKCI